MNWLIVMAAQLVIFLVVTVWIRQVISYINEVHTKSLERDLTLIKAIEELGGITKDEYQALKHMRQP